MNATSTQSAQRYAFCIDVRSPDGQHKAKLDDLEPFRPYLDNLATQGAIESPHYMHVPPGIRSMPVAWIGLRTSSKEVMDQIFVEAQRIGAFAYRATSNPIRQEAA